MAFIPVATELVLGAAESGEVGNIVAGAETIASQFKTQVLQGSVFGLAEGALFGAGEKLYHTVKKDLGLEKDKPDFVPPPPPKKRKRRVS